MADPELQCVLRTLVTKGVARHFTVTQAMPKDLVVRGGLSLQVTGLFRDSQLLREDTLNRLVPMVADDSVATTVQVIAHIKRQYSGRCNDDVERGRRAIYQNFFASLTPQRVHIPYAECIEVSAHRAEQRRRIRLFFDLLSTVTMLNQSRRRHDQGYLLS